MQKIATARVEVADMQPRRQGPVKSTAAQLASNIGFVRRSLSFTVVQRRPASCLRGYASWVMAGRRAARGRQQAEAIASRERRAQAIYLRQGRDIQRHGFGFLG